MPSSSVTSKGQITIPKMVREVLGVQAGDRVSFRIQDNGTVLVEAETVDVLSLRGALRPKVRGVTVEDMNEAIRKGGAGE
jgi:antitoxin PrlF